MQAGSLTRERYTGTHHLGPSSKFPMGPSHFRLPFEPSSTTDDMHIETMQHPSANWRSREAEVEREASLKKNCLQAVDRRARDPG